MSFFFSLKMFGVIVVCCVAHGFVVAQSSVADWGIDAGQWEELNAEKVVILKDEIEKGQKEVSHAATAAIVIEAPVKVVWDVIDDAEGAATYVKNLQKVTIVKETDEYTLVEQTIKIGMLKKVTYVVKNVTKPPHSMAFSRHSGDLKEIDGYWKLFSIDDGKKTLLVYRLGLKPGFAVPDFMVRSSLKNSLPEALCDVRTEVVRREAVKR